MGENITYLSEEDVERLRASAKESSAREELVVLTLLDSGLRRSELAHLREDWIDFEVYPPEIEVPKEDRCFVGRNNKPCHHCKDNQGKYRSKTESRRVPVIREETQEILKNWFKLNKSVASVETISKDVKQVAERADVYIENSDELPTPHVLRQTYGVKLAKSGLNAAEFRSVMGYSAAQTAQRYLQIDPETQDISAKLLDS